MLCALFEEKRFRASEIFSAEDTKMNESKYIIIIRKTCVFIENMIRIAPVHNSENQRRLQRGGGPSVFPEGDWVIAASVRWQQSGFVHALSQAAATGQGFSASAA